MGATFKKKVTTVNHDEYADGRNGQTDRRTDARPLHYAFRHGLWSSVTTARNPSLEVTSTTLGTFSSCDHELWTMTLTFDFDLDNVKLNQHAIYLGQGSFCSKVFVRTQADTKWTDCFIWIIKVVGYNALTITLNDRFIDYLTPCSGKLDVVHVMRLLLSCWKWNVYLCYFMV